MQGEVPFVHLARRHAAFSWMACFSEGGSVEAPWGHAGPVGQQGVPGPTAARLGATALGISPLCGDGGRLRPGWARTSARALGLAQVSRGRDGQGCGDLGSSPAAEGWNGDRGPRQHVGRPWEGWTGAVGAGGALRVLLKSSSIAVHSKPPSGENLERIFASPSGFVANLTFPKMEWNQM